MGKQAVNQFEVTMGEEVGLREIARSVAWKGTDLPGQRHAT